MKAIIMIFIAPIICIWAMCQPFIWKCSQCAILVARVDLSAA